MYGGDTMKKLIFLLILIFIVTLSGCDELDPIIDRIPDDITEEAALEFFEAFIESEMNDEITSEDHCNRYYETDIEECISKRDSDLAVNGLLTLYSFEVHNELLHIYKAGISYQDDETDEFLEYHLLLFYYDDEGEMQFSVEQGDHQYDMEDYIQMAKDYARDVMSDISVEAVCEYYIHFEDVSICETEVAQIREDFISMEYLEIIDQDGFYSITYKFNNGEYDENIAFHFQFVVYADRLKMMIYDQ